MNPTNYNYTNGSITFKLTYNGIPAKNDWTITNLQNFKPTQNPSIQINTQPQNVQAGNGLPAQIKVDAVGQFNPAASLSYQWYFKQNDSATPLALKNNSIYSGTNTATLNIASTNSQTIGTYYVVLVFPFANNVTSANATLSLATNPSAQINNVFHTTTSDGKQETSPALSTNVANAVNGINGSSQYISPDGNINSQGLNEIKKAIQKTLGENPDTAGYQNLPIKVTSSNVNDKNEININYQVGDIKGKIDNVNVGLSQNQASEKLTQWLNTGNNLIGTFQNYFNNNPNDILKFTLGRYVIGGYQWQNNQLPNVEVVPNSWKLLDNKSVIYTSQKKFVPIDSDIIRTAQNYVISQKSYSIANPVAWFSDTKVLQVKLKTTSEPHLIRTNPYNSSPNPPKEPIITIPIGSEITTILPYIGNVKGFSILPNGSIKEVTLAKILPTFNNNGTSKTVSLSWFGDFYNGFGGTYSADYSKSVSIRLPFVLNGITYYGGSIGYEHGEFDIASPQGRLFSVNQNGASGNQQANFGSSFNEYKGMYQWLQSISRSISINNLPFYLTNK